MAALPQAWDAAIDYLRLTYVHPSPPEEVVYAYQTAAEQTASRMYLETYSPENWAWRGYVGSSWGSVSVGLGNQGLLVQASGAAAHELFTHALPATNTPRLDLQVTYWYDIDDPGRAWNVARASERHREQNKRARYGIRVIDGMGDGDTCYIGRRGHNGKLLRVYDKWRQQDKSQEYRHAWRYEVELADEHALAAASVLREGGAGHHAVLDIIAGHCRERGVELPGIERSIYYHPLRAKARPESIARTVRWLEEQVAPALEKAISRGLTEDEARAILGL